MKSILAVTALFAMLSLCNLSDKMKPAANSNPSNTNSNERRNGTAENDNPAADREAVKAELMKLENEVTTASFNGDISVLARNMAENYVGTAAAGTTQTKNQILSATKPDKMTRFWTITDAQLVSLSGDSAVLSYIQTQTLRNNKTYRARITDTFVKQGGRWLISAEQQTLIR